MRHAASCGSTLPAMHSTCVRRAWSHASPHARVSDPILLTPPDVTPASPPTTHTPLHGPHTLSWISHLCMRAHTFSCTRVSQSQVPLASAPTLPRPSSAAHVQLTHGPHAFAWALACRDGDLGAAAARQVSRLGLRHRVYVVRGGFQAWKVGGHERRGACPPPASSASWLGPVLGCPGSRHVVSTHLQIMILPEGMRTQPATHHAGAGPPCCGGPA